jgi:hypothetical protein
MLAAKATASVTSLSKYTSPLRESIRKNSLEWRGVISVSYFSSLRLLQIRASKKYINSAAI